MNNIPNDWWEQLEKVEHNWGKPETLIWYDGEERKVRYCEECSCMRWDEEGFSTSPKYDSCRVTTDWPGDDSPCLCTRTSYLVAHKLI